MVAIVGHYSSNTSEAAQNSDDGPLSSSHPDIHQASMWAPPDPLCGSIAGQRQQRLRAVNSYKEHRDWNLRLHLSSTRGKCGGACIGSASEMARISAYSQHETRTLTETPCFSSDLCL